MRPVLKLMDKDLIGKIIAEGRELLCKLGAEVHNDGVVKMLSDAGASVQTVEGKQRVLFTDAMIDNALKTAPKAFKLYDVLGAETHDFSGDKVHFTPGSAAINILDHKTQTMRKPSTADYIAYAKLMTKMGNIASQSTAFIPADVHDKISDSYRLYLSLMYGEKPVVTGAFTIEAFGIMKDLLLAARGGEAALKAKPLAVFSCCPTAPLKWSDVTSQNVVDCAKYGIPVEYISMPLSGFMAPVTLVGSIIEHTAETLSGIVISQLASPGAPALYGGSPAAFDVRYETTPMGAVETMMIDCAYSEIGKYLGLPTQAYISLSDAKLLDAQAGLESAMGATLAALSGVNNISGPGMLDFESCQSLEKLVLDNEICGMALRLVKGIEPKEDFPSLPIFQELLKDQHLLISKHTRKYLKEEHYFPSPVIDRANRARWADEGSKTLGHRAHELVLKHVKEYQPSRLSSDVKTEMERLMTAEAKKYGMDRLPERTE